MSGRVIALARRPGKNQPLDLLDELNLDVKSGVVEDYAGKGKRQVTLIAREAWEAVERELDQQPPWQTRRANVLVEGVDLAATIGETLAIGECIVRIHGETVPCALMDELLPGLRKALEPECRGGVYGEIVGAGVIRPGDTVATVE